MSTSPCLASSTAIKAAHESARVSGIAAPTAVIATKDAPEDAPPTENSADQRSSPAEAAADPTPSQADGTGDGASSAVEAKVASAAEPSAPSRAPDAATVDSETASEAAAVSAQDDNATASARYIQAKCFMPRSVKRTILCCSLRASVTSGARRSSCLQKSGFDK